MIMKKSENISEQSDLNFKYMFLGEQKVGKS